MYEIPFISKDVLSIDEKDRTAQQTARLANLVESAKVLTAAGWPVEWTITGLAFDAPPGSSYAARHERSPTVMRQLLAGLGITEEFRTGCSPSLLDILAARVECQDRALYAEGDHRIRSMVDNDDFGWEDEREIRETIQELVAIEGAYQRKDLVIESDYLRGILQGRLQALEWLFGQEWPELEDDEDEWEAELLKDERDFDNRERAIETMHELLFEEQDDPADPIADAAPTGDLAVAAKAVEAC
jgi:hypothetical protein